MVQSPSVRFVTLDVFTKERFRGNPLAIVHVPLDNDLSQRTKQQIAREFNLSETVFLHPPLSEGNAVNRRYDIFTTTEELPFAGHPTIGTLVYLCQDDNTTGSAVQSITLQAKAGPIIAHFNGETGVAEASIPHNVRIHQTPVPLESILAAQPSMQRPKAGLEPSYPLVSIVKGLTFVLINLPQVEDLAKLTVGGRGIDRNAFKWDDGWTSFTVPYFYAIVSEDKDRKRMRIRSRMIEPVCGEDPATGSAASALSAYLALQRGSAGTAYSFYIEQGVEMGRHSDIRVKVGLDNSGKSIGEVLLSGSAVIVSQGTLNI
ncbi:MAG: hypothetical protein Q9225_000887 [Loekoesia sp. 1 TL-2023]